MIELVCLNAGGGSADGGIWPSLVVILLIIRANFKLC
jgi:hypothetical protein